MQMKKIKGTVERIENHVVAVIADGEEREYYFNESDLQMVEEGQKIEILAGYKEDCNSTAQVISFKLKQKPKPMKMASFSSLLKHMDKTLQRLKATRDDLPEHITSSRLDEQIAYLEKGFELFT